MMTTSKFVTRATLLMLSAISLSAGCGQERVVAPGGAGGMPEFKGPTAGEGEKQPPSKVDAYLAEKKALAMIGPDGQKEGSRSIKLYEWFTAEPAGAIGAEMMPVILLRILPDLAVEFGEKDPEDPSQPLFGKAGDALLAKFGFWADPGPEPGWKMPMGFTWTPGHKSDKIPISLAIRTCAGCHTGRVRLDDGTIRVLVGAPNTEILLHQYDTAVATFIAKYTADGRIRDFERAILRILDDKHSADPRFFFKNAEGYGPAEEARQVETFKAALGLPLEKQGILALMRLAAGAKLQGVANLKGVAYSKPNSPAIGGGPPGLIDSSGLGIAAFVAPAKLDPKQVLFDGATKNDVPALWNQWTRKQWQWDGNIRDVLARNLVAALGLVGLPDKMDITANVVVSEFIDNLPPAPYPFAMPDTATVGRGRSVYEANCIACHREDQHRGEAGELPVFDLGTDMNRAKVVRPVGYQIIEKEIVACYQPTDLRFRLGDKEFRPNQNVDGAALLIKRFTPETQGYVAPPMDGLWARAPYLHNGSVPTLRHLLVPSLREQARTFVRGAISYDTKNLGWSWEVDRLARLRPENPSARVFDASQDGQSNTGHDQKSWTDTEGKVGPKGRAYRLAWDDAEDLAVEALIAYLKTL
jgi:RoxA-like, cytochrome c-like